MKIQVGYRDKVVATGRTEGGKVVWQGDPQVGHIAEYYAIRGHEGDDLLRVMVARMNGEWWAVEVEDDADADRS